MMEQNKSGSRLIRTVELETVLVDLQVRYHTASLSAQFLWRNETTWRRWTLPKGNGGLTPTLAGVPIFPGISLCF